MLYYLTGDATESSEKNAGNPATWEAFALAQALGFLSTFCARAPVLPRTTQTESCRYPHFADEETETGRGWISGRGQVHSHPGKRGPRGITMESLGEGDTVGSEEGDIYLLRVGVNKPFFFLILEMLQPVTSNYL